MKHHKCATNLAQNILLHETNILDKKFRCVAPTQSLLVLNIIVQLFHFAYGLGWVKHVEWYWFCLCGHCFNRVFRKEKESQVGQQMVQMKTTTHTWKSYNRLKVEWTRQLQICLWLDGTISDKIVKIITPTLTKRNTNISEAITPSQHLCTILCYFTSGNTFEDLKFISAASL
jgi:hypothetical protein